METQPSREVIRSNIVVRSHLQNNASIVGSPELFGGYPAIAVAREEVSRAAPTQSNILLIGETGTGKENIAKLVHRLSGVQGAFIGVDWNTEESLLESTLFGQNGDSRGSYISSLKLEGGTIFLNNLTLMSKPLQYALLGFLVQSDESQNAGFRLLAASTEDLSTAARNGRFLEGLAHRLQKGVVVHLPPLRERGNDIALLANYYLNRSNEKYGKSVVLGESAIDVIVSYEWPGNLRELSRVMDSAAAMYLPMSTLTTDHILALLPKRDVSVPTQYQEFGKLFTKNTIESIYNLIAVHGSELSFRMVREALEQELLNYALQRNNMNRRRTSLALKMARTTFIDALQSNSSSSASAPFKRLIPHLVATLYRRIASESSGFTYQLAMDDFDRQLFQYALQKSDGLKNRAAQALGIRRSTFNEALGRLGIEYNSPPR